MQSSMDKWNKIVELFEKNRNAEEKHIQKTWENICSEIFGYSKLNGEIDSMRTEKIGSRERIIPDIIIKNDTSDLFMIELKRHILDEGEQQLFSYLKQLRGNIGVLINSRISIFDFDYSKNDDDQIKYEIYFKKDSKDGESFVELLSKPFSVLKVKEFIRVKTQSEVDKKQMNKLINNEYLINLLKNDLITKYQQNDVDEVLLNLHVSVSKKNSGVKQSDYEQSNYKHKEFAIKSNYYSATKKEHNQLSGVKIGENVRTFFEKASQQGLLSEEIISQLCDINYSKMKFKMGFPVLKEIPNGVSAREVGMYDNRMRYYRNPLWFNGKPYLLCAQWFQKHDPIFSEWKKSIE